MACVSSIIAPIARLVFSAVRLLIYSPTLNSRILPVVDREEVFAVSLVVVAVTTGLEDSPRNL